MNSLDNKKLFVFTGPDGSGRKTVAHKVAALFGFKRVLSYTTRQARPYESNGLDYHFITREQFLNDDAKGEFIETLEIEGVWYGIKSKEINDTFEKHQYVYLILNRNGSDLVKAIFGDKVIRILVYADRNKVMSRLLERGDTTEVIYKNMARYEDEMAYLKQCDHNVENYEVNETVEEAAEIVRKYL